mmetsp:Transcript_46400/g.53774  ORF Transcript_46400/g.53774 Transcript_46400/m.53774 type:complete len:558 (-) Transcript_46400:155-1828(-)
MINEHKDFSPAFEKKLTAYEQRPDADSRYIIQKNLKQLLEQVCHEINEFTTTSFMKSKAINQLKHIIVLAESNIREFLELIVRTMKKCYMRDEKALVDQIKVVVELLGMYVEIDLSMQIFMKLLNEEDTRNSPRLLSNLLEIFSVIIKNEKKEALVPHFNTILTTLEATERDFSENLEILISAYSVMAQMVLVAQEETSHFRSRLFTFFLTIQSIPELPVPAKKEISGLMEKLAGYNGFMDVKDLYSFEVAKIMQGVFESQSYNKWDRTSRERHKFEVMVRNCGLGLSQILPGILEVIQALVRPDHEVEVKFDALVLTEFILKLDYLSEDIKQHSSTILNKILMPCIQWKVGKPNIKIRRGGILNMILLLQNNLISNAALEKSLGELIPLVKSCMNDDWAPDLRHSSCTFLDFLFVKLREELSDSDLRDIYPALLERLDDSQDLVRLEITKAITNFFLCKNVRLSPSTFEYVTRNIMIHLDDQNQQLQLAVFNALKTAAGIDPRRVLDEARISLPKQKYPQYCKELIRYIEENLSHQIKMDIEKEKAEKAEEEEAKS